MSSSNESLTVKRGSTPSVRNHYPPITRTRSVGLTVDSNGQHVFNTHSRRNGFTDFGSNPSLHLDACSMDKLSLERTSSLGTLSEKRHHKEHSTTMKTISEAQLGGMFSDEDFGSDNESSGRDHSSAAVGHERTASEEQCSIDDSLMSDDCSTQSSTDTQITSSEIIDAAVTAAITESASSQQRLQKSLSSSPSHKLSPIRSPHISPLHRKLQTSMSSESRERVYGAAISPTLLSTPNGSSSQLKSILRSPSASITSLSSISPTHSASSEPRLSVQTSSVPSTPTSTSSADRTHSLLMEGGNGVAVNHTIVPTNSLDTPKNDKSPSPSPSMDLEVVACKTVVEDGQWLHGRSQSDTSNNRSGLQFHVTFVNDEDTRRTSNDISTLFEVDAALESDDGLTMSNNHKPLPIIRQASDSLLMSQHQATSSRPHRVMFSDCTQVLSFDSEFNDSDDLEEKIKFVRDDLGVIDLMNAEPDTHEPDVDQVEDQEKEDTPTLEYTTVSDKIDDDEPSYSETQPMAFLPNSTTTTSDVVEAVKSPIAEKKLKGLKKSLENNNKTTTSLSTHKRVVGKHVRELSQMFEGVPSSKKANSMSTNKSAAVQQTSRKMSVSKIPVASEVMTDVSKHNKTTTDDEKSLEDRNNPKSANTGTSCAPPKVATKPAKPLNAAAKCRVSTTERVGAVQSPTTIRKATAPARKNSIAQQKANASTKSATTSSAVRRVSRAENTSMTKHTSSPIIGSRRQSVQKDTLSSPSPKLKSSKSQTTSLGRNSPSTNRQTTRSNDLTLPRSKLQRQPSVVSSRSPSPFSSSQATHKPLSRLSGTRQPLRRKGGSNNSSPAATRKSSQSAKPEALELNYNNSNNNNNGAISDGDGCRGDRLSPSYTMTAQAHPSLKPTTSLSSARRSESFQCLTPSSLEKSVRFSIGDEAIDQTLPGSSIRNNGQCPLQCRSASRSDKVSLHRTRSNPTTEYKSTPKPREKINYHHTLHSSILRHSRKRSPLEWQNFALSWSSPNLGPAGHHPGLTSKRL